MTNLQAQCLTVIRIEGPISHVGLMEELGEGIGLVNEACAFLVGIGLVEMAHDTGLLDVTGKGRMRFSRLHRKKVKAYPREELPEQLARRAKLGIW